MTRQIVSSGSPWEPKVGYCRAVRVGNHICVSGTTASDEGGNVVAPGDAYEQTVFILRKIETALGEFAASLADVVRTRIFVTNIDQWEQIGRAHAELLGDTRPACTMVEIRRLVSPDLLVEIEADAVLDVE